jgi:hypothetical protein
MYTPLDVFGLQLQNLPVTPDTILCLALSLAISKRREVDLGPFRTLVLFTFTFLWFWER